MLSAQPAAGRHRTARASIGAAVLAGLVLLAGCSISQALRPQTYTVQRGDTLSEIAAQYHLDWRDLARWNRIGPPYRISVGQNLSLDQFPPLNYNNMPADAGAANAYRGQMTSREPSPEATRSPRYASPQPASQGISRVPSVASVSPQPAVQGASAPHAAPALSQVPTRSTTQVARSDQQVTQAGSDDDAQISAANAAAPAPRRVDAAGPSEDGWQWPATGSLVGQYDPDDRRQGIEIGGKVGDPVYAASSGTVVYDGAGLKGYGKLIIIKHDEHYLSAYGFNQRSLVRQGQSVAAGAQIADMGLGPENKPMLHFEIRRDGDPINPESVLPSH